MRKLIRILGVGLVLVCATSAFAQTIDRIETEYTFRSQDETNLCWLLSGFNMLEQMAGVPLSVDAILIPEIQSRALDRYLGHDTPLDGGAGPTRPFALALEHGLVPESVWKARDSANISRKSIIQNYDWIFSEIKKILERTKTRDDVEGFLKEVNSVILSVIGTMPPTRFSWNGKRMTAVDYAKSVVGKGDSIGWDFRNIKYDDSVFGRMPGVAWTTIMARDHKLIKITDVIKKSVYRVSADEAFDRAVKIFEEQRPVAFTFIYYYDEKRERPFDVDLAYGYLSNRPAATNSYTSSHLVLITAIIRDANGAAVGFEVLDSLGVGRNGGIRTVTKEFFRAHGKTIHEIGMGCATLLRAG